MCHVFTNEHPNGYDRPATTATVVQDVIILGAGASKPDGMPLQSDLLPLLLKARGERADRIRTGISDFFGAFGGHAPTFEETLGMLDLALQRQESFRGYPNGGAQSRVAEFRDDLIAGIATALDQAGRERAVYGRKLVERLHHEERLLHTGFISTNYDVIIDHALIELFNQHDIDVDYGVPYANYGTYPHTWQLPREGRSVPLYKIHGSLNWLYCSACTSLEIAADRKSAADIAYRPAPCKRCSSTLAPIVIPPSYFKALTNIHLHTIWNRAEQMLRTAKRLIFCGYSFPDADLHFKYILKRAEVGRTTAWDVQVVNRRQRSTVVQKAEDDRFLRFFKDKNSVTFTRMRFEDFAGKGLARQARPPARQPPKAGR
jgi:hypothetical protein